MKRRLAVLFFVCSALLVACQILAGIGYVDKDTLTNLPGDGAVGVDGPNGPPDPCTHAVPPPKPTSDDGKDSIDGFYLALKVAYVGTQNAGLPGFDLDGVCTCDKRPNTNEAGASTCTPKTPKSDCDPDGGVDNRGSQLFAQFVPLGVDIDKVSDINTSIADGKGGLLIYISNYNGKDNDVEVLAGAMRTFGIVNGDGCGTSVGTTPGKHKPGWCGKDIWSFSEGLVLSKDNKIPKVLQKGYVKDKMLVFKNDVVTVPFAGATLSFLDSVTAGKLEQVDGKWTFKATLAGRLGTRDLLRTIGSFADPIDKGEFPDGSRIPFCQNTNFFPGVQKTVCESVDISQSSAYDLKGTPCDAISSAVAFEAEQATVGDVWEEPESTSRCDPDAGVFLCP